MSLLEFSPLHLNLIQGGDAALAREKIVAAVAQTFICIADESKLMPVLGCLPLPAEVIPWRAAMSPAN